MTKKNSGFPTSEIEFVDWMDDLVAQAQERESPGEAVRAAIRQIVTTDRARTIEEGGPVDDLLTLILSLTSVRCGECPPPTNRPAGGASSFGLYPSQLLTDSDPA